MVQGPEKERKICFSNGCQFVIEAKTDRHWRIFFPKPFCRSTRPLRVPPSSCVSELTTGIQSKEEVNGEEAEIFQNNRFSAVSLHPSGLNLAFSLGVMTRQEFISLSCQLGKMAASLVLHLDSKGHLRHLFYRDKGHSFGQEVTCFDENSDSAQEIRCKKAAVRNTFKFWNQVWNCCRIWGLPPRVNILRDVVARLECLSSVLSL